MKITTAQSNHQPTAAILGELNGFENTLQKNFQAKNVQVATQLQDSVQYLLLLINSPDTSILKHLQNTNSDTKIAIVINRHAFSVDTQESTLSDIQQEITGSINSSVNIRVIHLVDLYGDQISPSPASFLNTFTSEPVNTSTQSLCFPLNATDAAQAVIKSLFLQTTQGKILEIGGQAITEHNLALAAQVVTEKSQISEVPNQQNQHLKDYIQKSAHQLRWHPAAPPQACLPYLPKPKPPKPTELKTLIKPLVPQRFAPPIPSKPPETKPTPPPIKPPPPKVASPAPKTSKTFTLKTTKQNKPKPPAPPKPNQPKTSRRKLIVAGLTSLIIFLSPLLAFGAVAGVLNSQLNNLLVKPNPEVLETRLNQVSQTSSVLTSMLTNFNFYYNLTLGKGTTANLITLTQIATSTTQSATSLLSATELLSSLANPGQIGESVNFNLQPLQAAYFQSQEARLQLESITSLSILGKNLDSSLTNLKQTFTQLENTLKAAHHLSQASESLLGFDSKKTYLILLQNNAELRPTGGFIGSYATVTLQKGQLLDVSVEDVYTADGQLRGYVEPPAPIQQYLGEASWFLRDSNWDPDFAISAQAASWFLQKEMGLQVDGVVGINMHTIQKILEITGPIEVPDYNETITARNLFDKVEYQAEINFFPGSTQKRDFIGSLGDNLLTKLQASDQTVLAKVFYSLVESANHQQLTTYFTDAKSQIATTELGWNGGVGPENCQTTEPCYQDHIYLVEANVGVNKANYFINRELSLESTVNTGERIDHQLTIAHTNTSEQDVWPGGRYKNYSRLYTPPGTKLKQITIDGQPISRNQIDTENNQDHTIFGFLVQTKPGESSTTVIEFASQSKFNHQSTPAYQLTFQKQPGTNDDQLEINLTSDQALGVVSSGQLENNRWQQITTLDQTSTQFVEFTP